MRSITVTIHCDWPGCDFAVAETDAAGLIVERPISVDKKDPRIVALCKSDNDRLDEILLPLLAKALKAEAIAKPGRKTPAGAGTGSATPASGTNVSDEPSVVCRVDGCQRPFAGRAGLAQHVTRTHDYASLAEYDMQYPATVATIPSG
jgi:hypothetical protein